MKSKYTSTKIASYIGYIVQAIVNNFLPILFIALQKIYGLSYEQLARLIVFNFVTQMVTDLVTPKIVNSLTYKKTAVLAHLSATIGLLMLGILPSVMNSKYLAISVSLVVTAFGSGLIEVIVSPIIENLPIDNKKGNMAFLHSFYCWGQAFTIIVTTALVFAFGYKNWNFIPLIWAVIPFINMFIYMKVPVVEPSPESRKATFWQLLRSNKFKCFMVMMLCAGACEIAMAEWASLFAQQALGVSKVIGDLAGPCAFAIFMGIGRIWYGTVAERISFRNTLIYMSIACFICYIIVAFCKIPFVALICCALCGFTVSISWPGLYSAGAKSFPEGASVMYSVFAMCGDTGCCLGPWILGIVADSFNLNIGFAAASLFPILMIIFAKISTKTKA